MYSISAVARMLDIPVATVRTWEDRYQQVVPARNDSGHRIFSRYQVEQLKFIRSQMSDGASAADAHRVLAEAIDSGRALTTPRSEPSPKLLILFAESDPYAAEFGEYFLRTEGFDVEVALDKDAAREVFAETSPAIVIVEVLISGGAGLELCRFFKQQTGPSVIAVSAVQARDAALDAGADAFLLEAAGSVAARLHRQGPAALQRVPGPVGDLR